ncbi:MAG: ABC transporter permease [Hyphomicrobiales bacterium]
MSKLFKSREFWLSFGIVVIVLGVTLRAPGFAKFSNLVDIFNNTSMLIILALGQMLVILTRSIDLSMASNLALSGMIVALINAAYPDFPIPALMLIASLSGLALGAFNGILVWKLGIPAIVVTLGTLTIFRGTIFLLAGGQWVNAAELSEDFIQLTRHDWLGLPLLSWFAIVIAVVFFLFMTRTTTGRNLYAIGVNPTASVYAGIDVGKVKFISFCISGLVSGFCGFLWVSRYVIGSVEVANGYELTIIAACVIGGISIAGGVGSVVGTILGALFLGIINSALPVINISPFWQMAISGGAIILAVILNARGTRSKGRLILRNSEGDS